jgi:hypothetical protein
MSRPLPFPGTSRFEVRKCLGAGGFGTVYEALDRKRSALVALKVLRQASSEDLYRFKQEFRSLSGISHRNLVTLYELCTEEERWFFSMELVQGTDFISHLWTAGLSQSSQACLAADDSTASFGATRVSAEGLGPLPATGGASLQSPGYRPTAPTSLPTIVLEQLLHSLQQLAEGLLFLHEQGFVHRDIKPANVRGESLRPCGEYLDGLRTCCGQTRGGWGRRSPGGRLRACRPRKGAQPGRPASGAGGRRRCSRSLSSTGGCCSRLAVRFFSQVLK